MSGNHSETEAHNVIETEVLVVGSGPIGATYTRKLVDAGVKVLMVDIGEQSTKLIGDHKKNSVAVQKDISLFTNSVKGELSLLSVPVDQSQSTYLEPVSWAPSPCAFIHNGQNPNQKAYDNLPAAAASRVVGGMGSHWTCCTPEQFPGIERSDIFSDDEWKDLYNEARKLFHTTSTAYDDSIRHQLVKNVLLDNTHGREFISMPLATQRNQRNKDYLEWTAPATILGDLAAPDYNGGLFELKAQHRCTKLHRNTVTGQIEGALLKDLLSGEIILVKAKKYVICAGATLTAGILFNSGFRPEDDCPALGHYLTEQTMAFCQIVLKRSLVDNVINDPYDLGWTEKVKEHQKCFPNDPLPFPFNDPDPQVYTPFSEKHKWHTQIHRDAFGYGAVPPGIDQRLVVDFRFFGYVKPTYSNYVEFSDTIQDAFGMPQPTFHYNIDEEDAERTHAMMRDMVNLASYLGGYVPGAEPKYLEPGSALHITGTYRAGKEDNGESVVDRNSKVWRQSDLYLGGCGVIPTPSACNPTLTAACFAIVGANKIVEELRR